MSSSAQALAHEPKSSRLWFGHCRPSFLTPPLNRSSRRALELYIDNTHALLCINTSPKPPMSRRRAPTPMRPNLHWSNIAFASSASSALPCHILVPPCHAWRPRAQLHRRTTSAPLSVQPRPKPTPPPFGSRHHMLTRNTLISHGMTFSPCRWAVTSSQTRSQTSTLPVLCSRIFNEASLNVRSFISVH